jgi:CRP-like cAMP-binding protein
MGTARPVDDAPDLGQFSPLNLLAAEQVEWLLAHSRIERLPPGRRLFDIGELDGRSIFLLAGQLALVSADNRIRMLKAATPEAGLAIAHRQPREATALARTTATVLCIDTSLLESLLKDGERAICPDTPDATEAAPEKSDGDDMPQPEPGLGPIFASPLFSHLAGPALETLMHCMDILEARPGDVIIREGEASACYHIIESGRFRVTGRRRRRGQDDGFGDLGRLDGFGEVALIMNQPHDYKVTALEYSRLLRIPKEEFLTRILQPRIKWINHGDIAPLMLKGSMLLDIRSEKAYTKNHLSDSINLPLRVLRQAAPILDRSRSYIICCDNGRWSAAAAFLLARQGMESMILNDTFRIAGSGNGDSSRR